MIPRGFLQASSDPDQIKQWWDQWPDANVGLVCGLSFFVLDVDGDEGRASLADLEAKHGQLPVTVTVETPGKKGKGKGIHIYLKAPDGVGVRQRKLSAYPGLETRANKNGEAGEPGGYVLTPPSYHPDGGQYEWLDEIGTTIAVAPQWLIDIINEEPEAKPVPLFDNKQPSSTPFDNFLDDYAATERRAKAYLTQVEGSPEGGRNSATFRAAAILRNDFVLDEGSAWDILREWNYEKNTPPLKEKELRQCFESAGKNVSHPTGEKRDVPNPNAIQGDSDAGRAMAQDILNNHRKKDAKVVAEVKEERFVPKDGDKPKFQDRWFLVPGVLGDIMNYTLGISAIQNKVTAFTGALSMIATMIGRKTTYFAEAETRSNIYLISLAGSTSGKNPPRVANNRIIRALQQKAIESAWSDGGVRPEIVGAMIADSFASGQGIVSAVHESPSILFQPDEMDKLLSRWSGQRPDANAAGIEDVIMRMYSQSTGTFYSDRRADKANNIEIHDPNMVILGTATPQVFFEALSGQSLRNGFVGRILVFEAPSRARRMGIRESRESRAAGDIPVPQEIIDWCWHWLTYKPQGEGNLIALAPSGTYKLEIPDDAEAVAIMDYYGNLAVERQAIAIRADGSDSPGVAIWGRYAEARNKLAMLYACSESCHSPRIGRAAAQWACEVAEYSCQLLIHMIHEFSAETIFHRQMLQIQRLVKKHAGKWVKARDVYRTLNLKKRETEEVVASMAAAGWIDLEMVKVNGRDSFRIMHKDDDD